MSAKARLPLGWIAALVAVVFCVGALMGSDGQLGQQALRWLAVLGAPQYEAYRDMYAKEGVGGEGAGTVDYLLFFEEGGRELSEGYFAQNTQVAVTGPTIFDNAVVVAVPEPVEAHADVLRAQPFVWMLVRDRPFFFCH